MMTTCSMRASTASTGAGGSSAGALPCTSMPACVLQAAIDTASTRTARVSAFDIVNPDRSAKKSSLHLQGGCHAPAVCPGLQAHKAGVQRWVNTSWVNNSLRLFQFRSRLTGTCLLRLAPRIRNADHATNTSGVSMKNFRRLLYCAAAATALFVAACGGGSSSTAPPTGTVNVQVTDAPSKDFDHVWVTISEVRFHTSNAAAANDPGWLKYPLAMPVTFDLAALSNGALASSLNGGISLPAGTYQQIRLVLVADTANLASSAAALGLTYNDQVDWTDANGTAHL